MCREYDLIPGNGGVNCPYNGEHTDEYGKIIECQCDECDYLMCCIEEIDFCGGFFSKQQR